MAGKSAVDPSGLTREPVWTDGKATGNRATREAIGLRVDQDGGFYFCLQSSPEDTPELTGALEADMTRVQVEGMLQAIRAPLERRWPFAEEPATHALQADSVHYELRAPWGIVHEHDLPDKQVFVTVHDRKDQEWLTRTLEEALRVMEKHPRKPRPKVEPVAKPAAEATASPKPESDSPTPESEPESDSTPVPLSPNGERAGVRGEAIDSPKPEPDSTPVPLSPNGERAGVRGEAIDSPKSEPDSPKSEPDSESSSDEKDA